VKAIQYYLKFITCALFLIITTGGLFAQQIPAKPASDSMQEVEILNATKRLTFKTINDSTKLTIIVGDVKLRQGTSLFYCDSCVINSNTNIFEAWGKVHINDSDTTNIYANHLQYLMKTKVAYLDGNVKLTDGHGSLTTPDLEYDMNTNLGIYKHGGKVINKKTVLTSDEGWYYSDMKDVYFKRNVILKDPAYSIVADSLLYNTESQTTRFISSTTITDSSGRVIKTREGSYNQQTGKAEFGQRPTIVDPKAEIEATSDHMQTDDSSGISIFEGNAVVVDKKNKTTLIAGIIYRNKNTDAILAVKKPLMIIVQDNDSIYVTADTLFSARLTDLYAARPFVIPVIANDSTAVPDSSIGISKIDTSGIEIVRNDTMVIQHDQPAMKTDSVAKNVAVPPTKGRGLLNLKDSAIKKAVVKGDMVSSKPVTRGVNPKDSIVILTTKGAKLAHINEKDSSNRYFEAYRHVRIFNDSLQAVCDSMFYSFMDSVFRLYDDPVVWSRQSQITGDTILLFTRNKKADRVQAFDNSFMVNKVDSQAFNQVKSSRMDGYFTNGDIDSVRAKGYAECIYYIQNEDSAFTGINESKSDIMDIYFRNKELNKVVFRSGVSGTIWPIRQKSPSQMRLQNFRWLESRRPKTKEEMYE